MAELFKSCLELIFRWPREQKHTQVLAYSANIFISLTTRALKSATCQLGLRKLE